VITGIHHFALTVSDADRSIAFYNGHFGLELLSDREVDRDYVERITGVAGAHVRIVHLRGYGKQVELLEYKRPRGAERARTLPDTGSAHLCFTSDDLGSDVARLQAAGVFFRSLPVETTSGPNRGGRGVYVEDPDGNAVEIVQVAPAREGS
jgi:catechol 2,3-dioxygenase-like lactoylglutathione lyase family enzyme